MRLTIKDIARETGVSPTTVSKALNGKGRMSAETSRRVLETAKRLGYIPNSSARALSRRELRMAAVYPVEPAAFYSHIARWFADQAHALADHRCVVTMHPYPSIETPVALREVLRSVLAERPDGLVLTCSHRFEEYADVIEQFAAAEIPIVYATIFGELVPGVVGGVRTNTYVAGQMAAEFLGLVMPRAERRSVALMVGAKHQLVYEECIDGFGTRAAGSGVEIVDVLETFGRADLAYEATAELFARHGGIDGVYVASHNSVGVCDYLADHDMVGDVAVIGHDLYPQLNERLRAGALTATIFQSQYEQGRDSVQLLAEHLYNGAAPDRLLRLVNPSLVLPSMIDLFPDYG